MKNTNSKLNLNSTRADIRRTVLSNIDFSNYTQQQKEIIFNVVKEITSKVVIPKENLSNLSYRKRVILDVTRKSISKLEEDRHIKVHNWIPKPQTTNINKLIEKRNGIILNWIPKPPK